MLADGRHDRAPECAWQHVQLQHSCFTGIGIRPSARGAPNHYQLTGCSVAVEAQRSDVDARAKMLSSKSSVRSAKPVLGGAGRPANRAPQRFLPNGRLHKHRFHRARSSQHDIG